MNSCYLNDWVNRAPFHNMNMWNVFDNFWCQQLIFHVYTSSRADVLLEYNPINE